MKFPKVLGSQSLSLECISPHRLPGKASEGSGNAGPTPYLLPRLQIVPQTRAAAGLQFRKTKPLCLPRAPSIVSKTVSTDGRNSRVKPRLGWAPTRHAHCPRLANSFLTGPGDLARLLPVLLGPSLKNVNFKTIFPIKVIHAPGSQSVRTVFVRIKKETNIIATCNPQRASLVTMLQYFFPVFLLCVLTSVLLSGLKNIPGFLCQGSWRSNGPASKPQRKDLTDRRAKFDSVLCLHS